MGKGMKIDPRYEKYVQTEQGLRVEGRQDFYTDKKQWIKTYTWMRYVDSKVLDDVDTN